MNVRRRFCVVLVVLLGLVAAASAPAHHSFSGVVDVDRHITLTGVISLARIRIGSLTDGKVTMFIPPHKTDNPAGAMGEGIAVDAAGNLYTAEANFGGVTKYVKE